MGNINTVLGMKARTPADLGKELHEAVSRYGNRRLTKKLIARGAPIDAKDDRGYTPLHNMVALMDVEMVQLLVAEGADKDALDSAGNTPLINAAILGRDTVAEALLAAGADASCRCNGFTALDRAAEKGFVRFLAVLIRHGVDITDAGLLGTAVHVAAAANKPDAIALLVAAGADADARNTVKYTPLHIASSALGLKAAVALLEHGAAINTRDALSRTPLLQAALVAGKRGAVEMVDLLLRWGADETATDRLGKTPADVAGNSCSDIEEVGGVEKVRKLLENAPADRAWRRRGLLVASRARPQMISLSTTTQPPGEWVDLMGRVLGLVEEGLFRTIVGYL